MRFKKKAAKYQTFTVIGTDKVAVWKGRVRSIAGTFTPRGERSKEPQVLKILAEIVGQSPLPEALLGPSG
jgi:hypothetical protein